MKLEIKFTFRQCAGGGLRQGGRCRSTTAARRVSDWQAITMGFAGSGRLSWLGRSKRVLPPRRKRDVRRSSWLLLLDVLLLDSFAIHQPCLHRPPDSHLTSSTTTLSACLDSARPSRSASKKADDHSPAGLVAFILLHFGILNSDVGRVKILSTPPPIAGNDIESAAPPFIACSQQRARSATTLSWSPP